MLILQRHDATPTLSDASTTEDDDESCEGDISFEVPREKTAQTQPAEAYGDEVCAFLNR